MDADFERAHGLEQSAFEIAVDAHDLARRLHLRAERAVSIDEFVERPARELDDAVVERRFEAGFRLLRDSVRDFIEHIADGDFGRNLCNRIARRFRGERRGTRHARVDLDDVVAVAPTGASPPLPASQGPASTGSLTYRAMQTVT